MKKVLYLSMLLSTHALVVAAGGAQKIVGGASEAVNAPAKSKKLAIDLIDMSFDDIATLQQYLSRVTQSLRMQLDGAASLFALSSPSSYMIASFEGLKDTDSKTFFADPANQELLVAFTIFKNTTVSFNMILEAGSSIAMAEGMVQGAQSDEQRQAKLLGSFNDKALKDLPSAWQKTLNGLDSASFEQGLENNLQTSMTSQDKALSYKTLLTSLQDYLNSNFMSKQEYMDNNIIPALNSTHQQLISKFRQMLVKFNIVQNVTLVTIGKNANSEGWSSFKAVGS